MFVKTNQYLVCLYVLQISYSCVMSCTCVVCVCTRVQAKCCSVIYRPHIEPCVVKWLSLCKEMMCNGVICFSRYDKINLTASSGVHVVHAP